MNEFAVITLSGRQYIVSEGEKITVEKLPGEVGDQIVLDQVHLYANGDTLSIGRPNLDQKVAGKISAHKRGKKVEGMKAHPGGRKRKIGHRAHLTEVEILSLHEGKSSAKKAEKSASTESGETPIEEKAKIAKATPAAKGTPKNKVK